MLAIVRSRLSRLLNGHTALTAALVVMVVLVAGATWQAVRAEASNRATAERTLRDYSAVAAWHFAREANQVLHNLGGEGMNEISNAAGVPIGFALPHPSVMIGRDSTCDSTVAVEYRKFAFRIDLPAGTVITAGAPVDSTVVRALAEQVPPLMRRGGAEPHRFLVPVIGGRPLRVASLLVRERGPARTPRAIYGVTYDSAQLARLFGEILDSESLLPPALVGRAPLRERLHIAVTTPAGHVLYASGEPLPSSVVATDSVAVEQGRLAVSAAIDPALAPALVIGGLPSSRLPMLFAVLAIATLLAGVGFVQLRRERELARLRSRFVANVSHELRTPLAQISMFGETLMLGRTRSQSEHDHFASIIHREARRLATLVESVLRFSRAEAGGTTLRGEPRELRGELQEALDHFAPLAGASGTRLVLDAEPGLTANVDPGALRQVVMNLLENATKYGPRDGTVVVRASASRDEALVTVDDEGPGIPAADRQRVLEPFTRLDRPDRPKVAGTGIGLAVVHDLVLAHGGRLWIDDAPGGGARVCFTLPRVAAVAVPALDAARGTTSGAAFSGR